MKTLALFMCLLLLFPAPTLAQNSNDSSAIPASDTCSRLGRACTAAAKELAAARDLIVAYEQQIAASDNRIDLARKEIQSLKELGTLEAERAAKLEAVIAAEREAKAALINLKAEQEKRIAGLEKKANRYKQFALIAGVAAVVAILIGARK